MDKIPDFAKPIVPFLLPATAYFVVSGAQSGDRQRFTLAHELGHILLEGRLSAELHEENAAELLGISLASFHKERKLEVTHATSSAG